MSSSSSDSDSSSELPWESFFSSTFLLEFYTASLKINLSFELFEPYDEAKDFFNILFAS